MARTWRQRFRRVICSVVLWMPIVTYARLVWLMALLGTPAAAQSTTEDGIRAVLLGDYQAAGRILRPRADDADDPVAQFFLAILYDTGQGVQGDQARACGLFLRASVRAQPFSEQSAAIAAFMQDQSDGGIPCVPEERWQGGPPQSFVLGPDHRIVFANTSVSVTYRGREQRTNVLWPPRAVFLPIRHTPLTVTRPAGARRDFFQWFYWMPDTAGNPSSWTLHWMLSEVVDDVWIALEAEENLAVAAGETPPVSFGVSDLVNLGVNANGEAELTIPNGPSARTEVIVWQDKRR